MALPSIYAFGDANGVLHSDYTQAIGSPRCSGTGIGISNAGDALAFDVANTYNDRQYAQIKTVAASAYNGPAVRCSGTSGYVVAASSIGSFLQKITSGTRTNIYNIPTNPSSGQIIRLEADGTTLRVYYNGVQAGVDQTDSSFTSGVAGWFQIDSATVDDFEGGNLAGGGGLVVVTRGFPMTQAVRRTNFW